eukprot:8525623-Ditylum_brightwellii.AAC.1
MKYELYYRCCNLLIPKELSTIPVQWINCHINDLEIDSDRKPVRKEKHQITDDVVNSEELEESPELQNIKIFKTLTTDPNLVESTLKVTEEIASTPQDFLEKKEGKNTIVTR